MHGSDEPLLASATATCPELPVKLPVQPNPAAVTDTHRASSPAPWLLMDAGGCQNLQPNVTSISPLLVVERTLRSPGSYLASFPQGRVSYTKARLSAVALASLKP